jgi:hypothetical protein
MLMLSFLDQRQRLTSKAHSGTWVADNERTCVQRGQRVDDWLDVQKVDHGPVNDQLQEAAPEPVGRAPTALYHPPASGRRELLPAPNLLLGHRGPLHGHRRRCPDAWALSLSSAGLCVRAQRSTGDAAGDAAGGAPLSRPNPFSSTQSHLCFAKHACHRHATGHRPCHATGRRRRSLCLLCHCDSRHTKGDGESHSIDSRKKKGWPVRARPLVAPTLLDSSGTS